MYSEKQSGRLSLEAQRGAYFEVQQRQEEYSKKKEQLQSLEFDIADSSAFLDTLKERIKSLSEAKSMAEIYGTIAFGSCPACHATIDHSTEGDDVCALCKTSTEDGQATSRLASMLNETGIQIKQSEVLQESRKEKLIPLRREIAGILSAWRTAKLKLQAIQRIPTSKAREEIRTLNRKLGYFDKEIENYYEKLTLAQKISALSERKAMLNALIDQGKTRLGQLHVIQQKRLKSAHSLISDKTREFLKNDLKREAAFENPSSVNFSFRDNYVNVGEAKYFSASSRVLLKSSFLLGFFAASLEDQSFMYPRFLMIDTTEDKGMEPERSHQFQNQILETSQNAKSRHQVIFATSMP